MEETRWLTKTKIIIMASLVFIIGLIVIIIVVNRNNLKKKYMVYEKQLEYAASNYLLKEKIKIKENQTKIVQVDDIVKQKLITNKYASDCKGYVVAKGDKPIKSKTNYTDNINYKAYIKCKKIYTTDGYGSKNVVKKNNSVKTNSDTTKPVIKLKGKSKITLKVGDKYKEKGATAKDNVDGNITKLIKISGKVDTSIEGTYKIIYSVTDSSNNKATKTRTIIVKDEEEYDDWDEEDGDDWVEEDEDEDYDENWDEYEEDEDYDDDWDEYEEDEYNDERTDSTHNNLPSTTTIVPVSKIILTPNSKTMSKGGIFSLNVSISPSNASDKNVTYSSSNESVASVDESGKVRGISQGSAIIYATSGNGVKGTCSVTVK